MTSDGESKPVCVFCARIAAGEYIEEFSDAHAVVFVPLDPVVEASPDSPGHLLIVSRVHVPDAAADPDVTAATAACAARLMARLGGAFNLITSIGEDATQTVFHLHLHALPRVPGDGVVLPWTAQQERAAALAGVR